MKLLILSLYLVFAWADATGPVLEADGWTPVRSSQVVAIPPEYLLRQQQEQQQRQQQIYHEREQVSSDLLVHHHQPEVHHQQAEAPHQQAEVHQQQLHEPHQPEVHHQPEQEEHHSEPKDVSVEPEKAPVVAPKVEEEKPPVIVYPSASISETEKKPEPVSVQNAAIVPDFLEPQSPPRYPAARPQLPPPPPRFNPKIRGPPPRRRLPLPPRQQAVPRNSVVTPNQQFVPEPAIEGRQQPPPPPPQAGPPPPQAGPPPPQAGPPPPHGPPPPRCTSPRCLRPRQRVRPSKPGGIGSKIAKWGDIAKCAAKGKLADFRLQDERFMRAQLNCVLERGPCDKTGLTIKRKTLFYKYYSSSSAHRDAISLQV